MAYFTDLKNYNVINNNENNILFENVLQIAKISVYIFVVPPFIK